MKKYSTRVINNYIAGNRDSVLENDKEFMMAVIGKTKNKKFIDYCSMDVKNDFDFVMFLVNTFNGDMEFITKIFNNYLSYLNTYHFDGIIDRSISRSPIVNDLSLAIKKNSFLDNSDFKNNLSMIYSRLRVDIELVNRYDKNSGNDFGMGFFCFRDLFGLNVDILNYVSHRMIKEILLMNNHLFRKRLFDRFNRVEQVEKLHLLCLDFLNEFDRDLVKYLVYEPEVLEESFNSVVCDILKNWDRYYEEYELYKYNRILNRCHRYYSKDGVELYLSEDEILLHLAYNYNVVDEIAKYNVLTESTVKRILDSFNDNHVEDILTYCDREKEIYDLIESVFKREFMGKKEIGYSLIKKEQ